MKWVLAGAAAWLALAWTFVYAICRAAKAADEEVWWSTTSQEIDDLPEVQGDP